MRHLTTKRRISPDHYNTRKVNPMKKFKVYSIKLTAKNMRHLLAGIAVLDHAPINVKQYSAFLELADQILWEAEGVE